MKCRLLNLVTAVSLALLVGVAVAWARSYFVPAVWHFGDAAVAWEVSSDRGTLVIERMARPMWNGVSGSWHFAAEGGRPAGVGPRWLRVENVRVVASPPPSAADAAPGPVEYAAIRRVWCDYWVLVGLSVPLPALWLVRRPGALAARRRAAGRCARCGYELRATPDKCPECGTIPTVYTSA